jgi:glycerophosphoryl diester phosphodiesterase
MLVNVEIKTDDGDGFNPADPTAAALADLVARRSAASSADRLLVSSFDADAVGRFHGFAPEVPTALLTLRLDDPAAVAAAVAQAGHVAIHPWDPTVDPTVVAAAHAAGVALNVWTVDDPDRVRQLAAMRVDAIVTNVPDVVRATLDGDGTPATKS